jgi:sigma-B regulation protein RsbU (phosphoserine phosphatase)
MTDVQVQYSDGHEERCSLQKNSNYIGRDAACDIVLEDSLTSRRHARLYRDNAGHYWVEDLHSKNGTTVNEREITVARVRDGDRIGIGGCVLTVHRSEQDAIVLSEIETTFGSTSVWRQDQRLALPQQRLEKLYELNERLTGRFDRDELLNEVMNVCIEYLQFDRGGIALWAGGSQPPQWVSMRNVRKDSSGEFRISRSIVQRALHHGERILINDLSSDFQDPTASMISNNIRSAMCVPLIYHDTVHGVLYGDRVTGGTTYTKEDIDFFAALGRHAAMALANVRLLDEKNQRERMEMQLQIARQIQNRLFPREPLVYEGLVVEAINDPGLPVSGDYYDYFVRPDGLVTIVIADVAGKGVPASLLMANIQSAVHVTLMEQHDLASAVTSLNRLVCNNVQSDRFITAIVGLLNPQRRVFSFVNAGHPLPICLGPGKEVNVVGTPSGFPLGIESDAVYEVHELALPAGADTLFFYTDGVPDAANERDELYGDERLMAALLAGTGDSGHDLMFRVRKSVEQFTRGYAQSDDITMLVAQFRAS